MASHPVIAHRPRRAPREWRRRYRWALRTEHRCWARCMADPQNHARRVALGLARHQRALVEAEQVAW